MSCHEENLEFDVDEALTHDHTSVLFASSFEENAL